MTDIFVSVAEFKAKLSFYLNKGRETKHRIVVMKRNQPIASVFPYDEEGGSASAMEGLASLAGTWVELEEIVPFIEEAVASREKEGYREIPF